MRTIAYTAITGDRDVLRHTGRSVESSDSFVCFADWSPPCDPYLGWRMRPARHGADPIRAAKVHKALAHVEFPDSEVSLWMNGTHVLQEHWTVRALADRFLKDTDLATFRHPERTCAYQEAEHCLTRELDDADRIRSQMARYRAEGFPEQFGLAAVTVLLRRHTPALERFNRLWWEEIQLGSVRDQLSFPYVLWKLGLTWTPLDGYPFFSDFFHYVPHGGIVSEGGYRLESLARR